MRLHYSQTGTILILIKKLFYYHTKFTTLKHTKCQSPDLKCFTTIQNYTTLKPERGADQCYRRFTTIQNYTTLKLKNAVEVLLYSFTTIQNYTTLKLFFFFHKFYSPFYYHTKLHYSQTINNRLIFDIWFYYHTKLHYSQTILSNVS